MPAGYRDVFRALADTGAIDTDLAQRLGAAAGLRNLIAHRYAVLDWQRLYTVAANELDDLLRFCAELARAAQPPSA